jgi:hypothetical protein
MVTKQNLKVVQDFERTIGMAELRALSKVSLERPLNDSEYKRMMELKERFITPMIQKKKREVI